MRNVIPSGINANCFPVSLTASRQAVPTLSVETLQPSTATEVYSKGFTQDNSILLKTGVPSVSKINIESLEESEKEKVINGLFVSDAPEKYKSKISNCLKKLPLSMLKTVEKGGFKIQVAQTGENAPLPFKVKEFDVEEFKKNLPDKISHFENHTKKEDSSDSNTSLELERIDPASYLASQSWGLPVTLKQIARKHGAESPEQEKEYVELIKMCNPDMMFPSTFSEHYEVPPGQSVNYPTLCIGISTLSL